MSKKTKIITKIVPNNDSSNPYFFGAYSDNIILTDNATNSTNPTEVTNFTLTNLYEFLKKFFTNPKSAFAMYSTEKPKNSQVKIWYDTKK